MNKIIRKIKEKDNIIVFLILLFISIGISLNIHISSNDEIWNFQNVYKIYNGFKIYENINIIVTPLFFWIANIIFHIFGANLFIFRISHAFAMTILYIFIYKILKKIQIPKVICLLTVLFFVIQERFLVLKTSFNYNNFALIFAIIGIYLLINNKIKHKWLMQAIISIIILLTKQNIGIYYIIGDIISIIVLEKDKKDKIKEALKYIGCIFIGNILFLLALLIDNNLYNFLNYTFGGILEFAQENIAFEISGIVYIIGIISINIISIWVIKKKGFSKKQDENINILFIFSIVFAFISYPIFNMFHVIMSTYISIIELIYVLYNVFKDFEKTICKITKVIDCLVIILLIAFSGYNMMQWKDNIENEEYPYVWEQPFFGGIIEKEAYSKDKIVIDYIKNNDKNVVVLSNKAALYMIPLKRNNGNFDLPFKGNLGIKGEKGLIEKIDNLKNTQILISKNQEKGIYQEVEKTKEHVRQTKKYMGEIVDFEIYE